MINISSKICKEYFQKLPLTYRLLRASNLSVHPAVYLVVLTGSRGLKGGYRADSDVDLSLLVDSDFISRSLDREGLLSEVIEVTLRSWKSDVELDTAAVFDKSNCGLKCFMRNDFSEGICNRARPDCAGLYKTQKGFNGYVPDIGLEMRNVYPMIPIWSRLSKSQEVL